jgi:hypothetical protein
MVSHSPILPYPPPSSCDIRPRPRPISLNIAADSARGARAKRNRIGGVTLYGCSKKAGLNALVMRRILRSYARYFNESRTHRSEKGFPSPSGN